MYAIQSFFKIFTLFNKREKQNSVVMFLMILIGAFAETLSISAILPFMNIIMNPEIIEKYEILQWAYYLPFVGSFSRFIVLMCVLLILVFILKSVYMFVLLYYQNRFALNRQVGLAQRLFDSYINKPYPFFFERNSAELLRNIGLLGNVINGLLVPGLSLITELLVVGLIVAVLFVADPFSAAAIIIVVGGVSVAFYIKLKTRLDRTAKKQNQYSKKMNQAIVEGIRSIKEIKVLCKEKTFTDEYGQNSAGFAKTQAFYNLSNQSPRLLIEALSMCGIVLVVLANVLLGADITSLLPVLSLFAVAAIRIMPSMNRILGYMTSMRFNAVHLDVVYEDLMETKHPGEVQPEKAGKGLIQEFSREIRIEKLSYHYPNTDAAILKDADLVIREGESIGLIGPSGAGKTTLVDLILGLLEPTEGKILVDGIDIQEDMQGWRNNLGYVPQSIFLIDQSIRRNVAFGIPEGQIDDERIWKALGDAQMKEFVQGLPDGLDTVVGESGMRLSGGQRQRIGIARALYHDPEILVFDEATSALDTEVETLITEAIDQIGKTKTMIIIAHRVNTLEKCHKIYRVMDHQIFPAEDLMKEKAGREPEKEGMESGGMPKNKRDDQQ